MTEEGTGRIAREPGLSVRLKLTLSYAALLMVAGVLLLAAVWFSLQFNRPEGWVIITTDRAYVNGMLRSFLPAAAVAAVFLAVFGLGGGWILAGRMLAPLRRITAATRRAATGSLSHRIELEGKNDEFRELADAFDTMLARLEAHVGEQQRFAANASHELRTPLAITQVLLDLAATEHHRDDGELLRRLRAVNTRAIDLTEALLLLSRTDGGTFAHEAVDLSLLAEQAAETLLPLAERHHVVIEASGEIARTLGSPTLLGQMVTNLVHNGIVHNLPEGGWVHVAAESQGDRATITVANTGPLLSSPMVSTLTEPFQRGSGRARSEHAGAGLGLAIVKSIVRAHRGTLTLVPGATGGLRVIVHLPGPPPP